jgi:hypothetical protein
LFARYLLKYPKREMDGVETDIEVEGDEGVDWINVV